MKWEQELLRRGILGIESGYKSPFHSSFPSFLGLQVPWSLGFLPSPFPVSRWGPVGQRLGSSVPGDGHEEGTVSGRDSHRLTWSVPNDIGKLEPPGANGGGGWEGADSLPLERAESTLLPHSSLSSHRSASPTLTGSSHVHPGGIHALGICPVFPASQHGDTPYLFLCCAVSGWGQHWMDRDHGLQRGSSRVWILPPPYSRVTRTTFKTLNKQSDRQRPIRTEPAANTRYSQMLG